MKYQISRATDSDLPLMQRLFYQTVTIYGSKIFTKSEVKIYSRLATDKKYWKQKFISDFVYNAKLNGEIVGSFLLNNDGTIDYIFVHQNYQGRGIARKLYETIEQVAKESGIDTLTTKVNTITRSFFEKHGFKIIENVKKIAGGGEEIVYSGVKKL
ncbi:GNAT family N-acetyltransferase [Aquimarina sp. RZ0]|uniref:GNAT family N-acetyltransferase n=1 Tax=Aquimarina sp. RZ0 TaxID=2607730 RepID=UPI0011F1D039|nr:GNAT family N-acetyltransferase [Aquimarina sp. RZ0]KAA1245758.1 GNAT family N-acetyltransferase [Aquimarina sp. RZ0]